MASDSEGRAVSEESSTFGARGALGHEQVLLVADEGGAASLVGAVLAARGYHVARAPLGDPDLFSSALGRQAIVYFPASNLLSAQLGGGVEASVSNVLRAARAPGVALVVAALPEASSFDKVVDDIARSGKPYVVVRTPGLIEEAAEAIQHAEPTLWLPRAGRVEISRGSAFCDSIVSALETEDQGRVIHLANESYDVAGLFAAASSVVGGQVRVRAVAPLVYRVVRPVARWLKGGEPKPLAFVDQLLARQAPANEGAALAG